MKKVKLNYRPVATRKSNETAYEVSYSHAHAVNQAIERKVQRNAIEQQNASKGAADFNCKWEIIKNKLEWVDTHSFAIYIIW